MTTDAEGLKPWPNRAPQLETKLTHCVDMPVTKRYQTCVRAGSFHVTQIAPPPAYFSSPPSQLGWGLPCLLEQVVPPAQSCICNIYAFQTTHCLELCLDNVRFMQNVHDEMAAKKKGIYRIPGIPVYQRSDIALRTPPRRIHHLWLQARTQRFRQRRHPLHPLLG